jgi:DNA helicase-2/ATP-dependent DNA helicase PcrA
MLSKLNNKQQEAVLCTEGPVLIVAGAGSGKTLVLTTRIKYLIEKKGVHPEKILAVTFTNKAAKEMEKRVGYHLPWLGTFHSICGRILRQHISAIPGYTSNYVIYADDDQQTVIKEVLAELNIGKKEMSPYTALNHISKIKNQMQTVGDYIASISQKYQERIAELYKRYQKKLQENNALDFDDMLLLTIKLFEIAPQVLAKYQQQFLYILVDEYQDTNKAQYLLIKQLATHYQNVCVVGDSDQNIYSWRGADITNILSFEKDYRDSKTILLEQNYRSTQNILRVANEVIKVNQQRKEKNLWTENPEGHKTFYYVGSNEHDEAKFVMETIDRERAELFELNNYAIFYRTNAQSRVFEEALIAANIKYRLVGGVKFYSRREIKDMICFLRVLANHRDDVALGRIVNVPARGISPVTVENYKMHAQQSRRSLYEVLGERISGVNERAVNACLAFKKFMTELETSNLQLGELIEAVCKKSGYHQSLMASGQDDDLERLDNIYELGTMAQEKAAQGTTLLQFLEQLALLASIDEVKEGGDAVTLMTLHSAKGLEFPIVFLTGLEESVLPHFRSLYDPAQMEEERRLCYVGITRARYKLFLSSAKMRTLAGETRFSMPSRFIGEIPPELLEYKEAVEETSVFATSFEPVRTRDVAKEVIEVPDFFPGDNVFHSKWGKGKVLNVIGQKEDQTLDVQFTRIRKTIMPKYAKLEKVK